MRISFHRLAAPLIAWVLCAAADPLSAQTLAPGESRLARYSTENAAPAVSQTQPLEAIVQVNFPRAKVQTVGDAVAYLLLRTGYRLAPLERADEYVQGVLGLALPEVHRTVGPYTVSAALRVLIGRPFVMTVDPVRREVSYRIDKSAAAASVASSRLDTDTVVDPQQ